MSAKRRDPNKPVDSRCVSKAILARRIPDSAILDAIAQVRAARKDAGNADLWAIIDCEAYVVVPLWDVIQALPQYDDEALTIKGSIMMLKGVLVGCFCRTFGVCCNIGIKPDEPTT